LGNLPNEQGLQFFRMLEPASVTAAAVSFIALQTLLLAVAMYTPLILLWRVLPAFIGLPAQMRWLMR